MFHENDQPLRHLHAKLDGKIVNPRSFAGPVGKLLASCENLAIVKFEPTSIFNLGIEPSDLSTANVFIRNLLISIY